MRAEDLDLRELLEFSPAGGPLHFAGQRVVLTDVVALGLLRKELVESLGVATARAVLTRFGYAHGWRTAQTLEDAFPWDSAAEWRRAGGRLHQLQGLLRYEPVPRPAGQPPAHLAQAVWQDSYEAEAHLAHLGRSTEPVCWTLCGFASGYLGYCHGRSICCVEERCRGRGDAVCVMAGRPTEEWGEDMQASLLYFQPDAIHASLRQVTRSLRRTERRLRSRRSELDRLQVREAAPGLVAESEPMRRLLDLARRVAQVDSTLLLTGESGTGKEVIARMVHAESARALHPFVAVNCAAVPEDLLESELFGHRRGAFTGATQDRIGLFEAAAGGTLLLDEIGDTPPGMQAKLLRVLEEREVRRVGENQTRPVDVRVMAASHRDLEAGVAEGRFREDLLYRLRVIELPVPPLRERREDVLPLARAFLAEVAARDRRRLAGFTPRAADRLLAWHWPGNVRELRNAVERAAVLAREERVDVEDLPGEVQRAEPSRRPGSGRTLAEVEREHILRVLDENGGHRGRTADALGIGQATLFRRLKRYGRR